MTYETQVVAGSFYESPEWYGPDVHYGGRSYWAVLALFDAAGRAKPALDALNSTSLAARLR
jgi:hypothetical protein